MELVTRVRDPEHWAQLREACEKKLLVVDAHKEWCGPCKIMEPTYKRIMTEMERSDQRLAFASLNVNLGVDGVEDNGSCKPRFLLVKSAPILADETLSSGGWGLGGDGGGGGPGGSGGKTCRVIGTCTLAGLSAYFLHQRSRVPMHDAGQRRWLLLCSGAFAVAGMWRATTKRFEKSVPKSADH
ncbi:hypothetical protein P43SY_004240 [Pythium insidiosum]|uniref:Thioredoxin domain-containing protein n=1 Tax=Pythium insidiosum TaxID=114742 RepID=A0AAD5Q5G7_PYTIN|nr:hypothetical protein P43SY_004240 [Pythium insidiosum]